MSRFRKLATGRNVLALLVLFLFFNFVIIPAVYPPFQTLDVLPSYSPAQARQLISSYGAGGRHLYLVTELTLDIVYPFVSAIFFGTLILYTFQHAFPAHPWTHRVAFIPFFVMAADYLENACIVSMLLRYPAASPILATVSNIFTIIKTNLGWFELIFMLGLIGWIVRAIRHRPPAQVLG